VAHLITDPVHVVNNCDDLLCLCGLCAAVCADLDTAEAGDACREAQLAQDKLEDYSKVTAGKQGTTHVTLLYNMFSINSSNFVEWHNTSWQTIAKSQPASRVRGSRGTCSFHL
jgi:hypothetical protein